MVPPGALMAQALRLCGRISALPVRRLLRARRQQRAIQHEAGQHHG